MRNLILTMLLICFVSGGAEAQRRDTTSISIIGDVMMHSRQMQYPMSGFLKDISPALQKADYAIANMEFTLAGPPYTGYPSFSAPDEYAGYVKDCGVDIFLTANNHILDKGSSGLERTLSRYRNLTGVRFTGSGSDGVEFTSRNPLIIHKRNFTFAIVNFTYGTNDGAAREWPKVLKMNKKELEEAFIRANGSGADYIIAIPHWGEEYRHIHNARQKEWAEWMVSKGADAIIGAHPHVVQDSTHINGVPVIYSIGNAVSNMSAKGTRLELCVTLRFVYDWSSGEKTFLEPELRFMWCTLPGTLTDSYATIFIDQWKGQRDAWKNPADYDNMMATLEYVKNATGIQ